MKKIAQELVKIAKSLTAAHDWDQDYLFGWCDDARLSMISVNNEAAVKHLEEALEHLRRVDEEYSNHQPIKEVVKEYIDEADKLLDEYAKLNVKLNSALNRFGKLEDEISEAISEAMRRGTWKK